MLSHPQVRLRLSIVYLRADSKRPTCPLLAVSDGQSQKWSLTKPDYDSNVIFLVSTQLHGWASLQHRAAHDTSCAALARSRGRGRALLSTHHQANYEQNVQHRIDHADYGRHRGRRGHVHVHRRKLVGIWAPAIWGIRIVLQRPQQKCELMFTLKF